MLIGDIVIANARIYPRKVGIVDERVRFTWIEFNERVNRLANALPGIGTKKGERVALIADNCHEFGELLFAGAKAGIIIACLNHRFPPGKLAYMVDDCQPRALFVQERFLPLATEVVASAKHRPQLVTIDGKYESLLASASAREPEVGVGEEDTFIIQYTTGTTGAPKGIDLPHRSWMNNCYLRFFLTRPPESEAYLISAGLYAAGNLAHFLTMCYAGVKIVVPAFSARTWVEMVENEKVTSSYVNPTIYRIVRDFLDSSPRRYDLSSLRKLAIGGGQPCSGQQLREILDYFNIPYTNSSKAYGQAEIATPASFLMPGDVAAGLNPAATDRERRRLESVGTTLGNTRVRVVDENDRDMPPGEKGEILLKSDGVMRGYWNKPEQTARALRGGWYRTSDLGFIDEDGYLYFAGRKDFLIKSGGFFVAPEELEKAIELHPAVAEAAVVGVPDEKWGQMVRAIVHLKPGAKATPEDIIEHCRKHLARYQVPKDVVFTGKLPRETGYGKIVRQELLQLYGAPKSGQS